MILPPLVLTGGPAAGKSFTATRLARTTPRCAFIDVDDVRQLIKSDGAAPWEGNEGLAQQRLGVQNTSALATNFIGNGFNVTIADVVTAETLALYRDLIPAVVVVRLSLPLESAWQRAKTRPVYLTDEEFEAVHRQQEQPLEVDHVVEVGKLTPEGQVESIRQLWVRRG